MCLFKLKLFEKNCINFASKIPWTNAIFKAVLHGKKICNYQVKDNFDIQYIFRNYQANNIILLSFLFHQDDHVFFKSCAFSPQKSILSQCQTLPEWICLAELSQTNQIWRPILICHSGSNIFITKGGARGSKLHTLQKIHLLLTCTSYLEEEWKRKRYPL